MNLGVNFSELPHYSVPGLQTQELKKCLKKSSCKIRAIWTYRVEPLLSQSSFCTALQRRVGQHSLDIVEFLKDSLFSKIVNRTHRAFNLIKPKAQDGEDDGELPKCTATAALLRYIYRSTSEMDILYIVHQAISEVIYLCFRIILTRSCKGSWEICG